MGTILSRCKCNNVRKNSRRYHFFDFLLISRFVVDSADKDKLETAKVEFQALLEKPQLNGIPILLLGNKNDLPESLTEQEMSEYL